VLALALALIATASAACAVPMTQATFPPLGSTPQPPGDATAAAQQQVITALTVAGLQAAPSVNPYRPPEGPLLAAAPRSVVQVALDDDPTRGYIVIYALGSAGEATAAAADHAAYLASNTGGRALFPPGTEFVIRVLGSSVVVYSWLPADARDPRTPAIATALQTIGTGVQVPG
jgi:hypothetical protein